MALDRSPEFLRGPSHVFFFFFFGGGSIGTVSEKNLKEFIYARTVHVAPIHQSYVYLRMTIPRTVFNLGHPKDIPVKLNLTSRFRGEDILRISSCPYSANSSHSPEPFYLMDQNFANNF